MRIERESSVFNLFAFLAFFASTTAHAGIAENAFFRTVGWGDRFLLRNGDGGSEHYVRYYIPPGIETRVGNKAIVFLHGGSYRPDFGPGYGIKQTDNYFEDLIRLAYDNDWILVTPGSHLGWTRNLNPLLEKINQLLETELKVSEIVLTGHSMGAMGVSRIAPWMNDRYKGFVSFSGVIDDYTEEHPALFRTFLNTPFHSSLGTKRIWSKNTNQYISSEVGGDEWINASARQKVKLDEMSKREETENPFLNVNHDGTHNPNYGFYETALRDMFNRPAAKRNKLFGFFSISGTAAYDRNRYFWLKASKLDEKKPEEKEVYAPFTAIADGNEIKIDLPKPITRPYVNHLPVRELEVSIAGAGLKTDAPVKIIVNKNVVYSRSITASELAAGKIVIDTSKLEYIHFRK